MSEPKTNGEWCSQDCPFLKPYGKPDDLTARCEKRGEELSWNDFWLAMCTQWWCPTCKEFLDGIEVTYEETHDERCGGCGGDVLSEKP